MNSKTTQIIVVVVLIIIVALAYWWFAKRPVGTLIPVNSVVSQEAAQASAAKPFVETKTNPFQADVNPIQGYKNPFNQ